MLRRKKHDARPNPVDGSSAEVGAVARRDLLLTLGAVGVAAASGSLGLVSYRDEAQAVEVIADPAKEHQWCRVVDLRKCTGERKCVSSCQMRHGLPPNQTWMRVLSWKDDAGEEFFMPVPCQMCENPPCLDVCPVGANFHTPQGVVLVDQEICIGSRACMAACPYEARYFNWSAPAPTNRMPTPSPNTPEFPANQIGTVGKCVLCADLIPYSKQLPACVDACPNHVHYIGDLITDAAVNGASTERLSTFLHDNNAVRFKEELGTSPRTYYILGNGQPLGGPLEGVK
ncbi:MAG: 4Fe-4S dicluster domain-containing protein [Candidatus Nanopelagicales bacterium]|nr:4Fe-4S dicluster domain-containing protein [Candidatus Nanopelagicales bacterium]MDZ4248637.1 4Fe-4S dicluster domain-containing protein [Candidatus Nanopelagicales bacterium]